MSIARLSLAGVGVVAILMSLVGFWYNSQTIGTDFSDFLKERDIAHFYPAFYTMTAICLLWYFLLLYIGVQFICGRTNFVFLFVMVLLSELFYFFAVGMLWQLPEYGRSIAAATGVANGGLMFQAFILFLLWAPIIAFFASRSIDRHVAAQHFADSSVIGS